MGIRGLMKLLSEECPEAIKEQSLECLTGRKVAVDASMAMYQFLVAVRSSNGPGGGVANASMMLTNEAGEVTSHIQGMFNRTIKLMSAGVKPVYIFDGKPPTMKGGELAKRIAKRAKAESDLAAAKEAGDADDVDKFSRRLVKVTRQHNDDCKELLRLMGVPVFTAPCEAEAQCAELAKKGKVYAVATEDMDALTFRTPKLLRKLTFTQGKDKAPILEIDCEVMLRGLGLTYEQFVDLCILCGCDYCSSIKGIGPKSALKLIKQYQSIENITNALKRDKKVSLPSDWFAQKIPKTNQENSHPNESVDDLEGGEDAEAEAADEPGKDDEINFEETIELLAAGEESVGAPAEEEPAIDDDKFDTFPPLYAQARELFHKADVIAAEDVDLKWTEPDEAGLTSFLVEKMGFNADRVSSGIKKLQEAQAKKAQKRLDSFFAPVTSSSSSSSTSAALKRKAEEAAKGKNKSAKSSAGAGMKRR